MKGLKIIIPMAGIGKRLFPLTKYRPKPLLRLANMRLLDHVLYTFKELEKQYALEYVFIVGYLGAQIQEYMRNVHPDKNVTYFVQDQLAGQSHAVYLAREAISGLVLLTYGDTINKADYSFLTRESFDGVAFVEEVDDPRRHGVAVVDSDHFITRLVEKPTTMENNLALSGLYYFSEGKKLIDAIEAQMQGGPSLNNEYYLADAINILVENGMRIRTERILQWLDAGTPKSMIETNAVLLQDRSSNHGAGEQSNIFIDPVYIHESSHLENAIIGPNVAIGANCVIDGSILKNTIVDDNSTISDVSLADSLLGQGCSISGRPIRSMVADFDEIEVGPAQDDAKETSRE